MFDSMGLKVWVRDEGWVQCSWDEGVKVITTWERISTTRQRSVLHLRPHTGFQISRGSWLRVSNPGAPPTLPPGRLSAVGLLAAKPLEPGPRGCLTTPDSPFKLGIVGRVGTGGMSEPFEPFVPKRELKVSLRVRRGEDPMMVAYPSLMLEFEARV